MPEYSKPNSVEALASNFEQIKPLMNPTMAYYESSRCLYCYDAPCVQACPTSIDIPLFIRQINNGNMDGAARTIYSSNYFGNACGKVCPTEVLCEGACVYNNQEVKPIEIGRLQNFATEQAIREDKNLFDFAEDNGKKVAVIGAGPAGISCACELRTLGYQVDIFEAKDQPSGLTLYGVAPYKIKNEEVLEEMAYLQKQFGFKVIYNHPIKEASQLAQLEENYEAIFLGIGLANTASIGIEGEDLENCIGATEYIEQIKLHPLSTKVGHQVIVIGGGNTAMDAASESARLGADHVVLAYRRSKEQKGAYEFEYDLAKAVGVKGMFNVSPKKILGTTTVTGVRFVRTQEVGGRLVELEDSEFDLACDMVIRATGQAKQVPFLQLIKDVELDRKNRIKIAANSYQTTNPKYFAAGDAVNGGAEVVNACAEAKVAAQAIHHYIQQAN